MMAMVMASAMRALRVKRVIGILSVIKSLQIQGATEERSEPYKGTVSEHRKKQRSS
jgi:hypothetical protein